MKKPFADATSHLLSCTALMHCNGASTAGHALVGEAIAHHLIAAGLSVNYESEHLKPARKQRPDLLIVDTRARKFLSDHTIVNPLASSRNKFKVPSLLKTVANTKMNNYREMAAGLDASFVPLPISALGFIPEDALKFLRLESSAVSTVHVSNWVGGGRGLVSSMLASVSCAVQKRNAHIIAISAQRALSYRFHRGAADL